MNYFFIADEHYFHANSIRYCDRPFSSVEEMNETIIDNHNKLVRPGDVTVHAGDFAFVKTEQQVNEILKRLNGSHILLRGSHDKWMGPKYHEIWSKRFGNQLVVCCHYAMRVWEASHYNSWLCYGHSHGQLPPEGKSWDVGVDNNQFYPVAFDHLEIVMKSRPDNFNLVRK